MPSLEPRNQHQPVDRMFCYNGSDSVLGLPVQGAPIVRIRSRRLAAPSSGQHGPPTIWPFVAGGEPGIPGLVHSRCGPLQRGVRRSSEGDPQVPLLSGRYACVPQLPPCFYRRARQPSRGRPARTGTALPTWADSGQSSSECGDLASVLQIPPVQVRPCVLEVPTCPQASTPPGFGSRSGSPPTLPPPPLMA